jgi:non-ribosomal peptide synthetase component F
MPPRKASKAAKPPGFASAASGFEASPEALATAARAAGELWWWDASERRWRTRDACVSPGAGAKTALKDTNWTPWHSLCDTSEAPYFKWFAGAETNACFNACDRHVLDGRGDEVALTALPEEITELTPRVNITRRELLGAVATVAARLRDEHGVRAFDRVLFHMPTDVTHCVYMLACQRLGAAYSATAVDAAEDVLVSRIEDLHPKLVVAAPGGATKHAGVAVDCAAKARRAAMSAAGASVSPPAFLEAERDFEHLRLSCRLARWAAMSDAQAF